MFKSLLGKIAKALDGASIPYMIIGGQAVLRYGEPRLTRDIDITLGLDAGGAERVLAVVKKLKFRILVDDVDDFISRTMVLPVSDDRSGIRIDLIFSNSSYEKSAIERGVAVNIGGVPVRFASLEDVIIHKIIAGRPRDIEDIKAILLKNKEYDNDYIVTWLKEFDSALGMDYDGDYTRIRNSL